MCNRTPSGLNEHSSLQLLFLPFSRLRIDLLLLRHRNEQFPGPHAAFLEDRERNQAGVRAAQPTHGISSALHAGVPVDRWRFWRQVRAVRDVWRTSVALLQDNKSQSMWNWLQEETYRTGGEGVPTPVPGSASLGNHHHLAQDADAVSAGERESACAVGPGQPARETVPVYAGEEGV